MFSVLGLEIIIIIDWWQNQSKEQTDFVFKEWSGSEVPYVLSANT